ncbi:YidC/Oxa1 family membrane protein insertase [Paenibacillus sp. SYP-B3998]|uniref:YidC/Oxa1 family membrane protein insertase n=1 Tax=Paenibacillus sp. SYP-B3998 TaxID=2678564 RepID=A0A6G4A499_9BACL|nr:YidC/Oxa1 family membrane protein insertase [Paenibacillus sp. SYP-B3998]NEW08639.1 YidC/Oxa1 family membrane protein insertase [Paenibacillus sp. SYP-B3998]
MDTLLHPIITLLFTGLSWFHGLTSDWGIAIILLTLLVRALLFPLNLRIARQQFRQAKMQPILTEIRLSFAKDQTKLLQETSKVYKQFGVKPLSMIAVSLVQAPLFLSLYRVFTTHGTTMTSHFVPWIATLGQSDPMHIVPLAYAAVTFISMVVPLTNEIAATGSILSRVSVPALIVLVMAVIIWSSPVAIGLYWTTNSLFAIGERIWYRTPLGKKWIIHGSVALNGSYDYK